MNPELSHVFVITSVGVPSQIAQVIVSGVSVIVTTLHSGWAWAYKRLQHGTMNIGRLAYSVFAGLKSLVSTTLGCELQNSSTYTRLVTTAPPSIMGEAIHAAYSTEVRRFVCGKARNWTPDFFFGSVLLRHDSLLNSELCLGPHGASTPSRLAYFAASGVEIQIEKATPQIVEFVRKVVQ